MKGILKKFILHKTDEMGQYIIFKAQRNAYVFLIIALLLWSLYESYCVYAYHSILNPFPCFLLVAAVMIQTFSRLTMNRNAVKDDEDSYETEPFIKIVIFVCLFVCIIATVGAAIILMGVKK